MFVEAYLITYDKLPDDFIELIKPDKLDILLLFKLKFSKDGIDGKLSIEAIILLSNTSIFKLGKDKGKLKSL